MTTNVGSWSEVQVAGHLCDVFEPARPHEHGYVVVYLHGVHLQRLNDNQAFTTLFDKHGLRVIGPMTGPTWWTDRISRHFDARLTPERHLLDNILPYIHQRWQAVPSRIALVGTSMGGQGALRFGFKHPNLFPVVAAISPAIDYQSRLRDGDPVLREMYADVETARQDTATLHVHPLNWPRHIWFCCDPADDRWHESADRLRMKLYSLGIPHECDLETSAGGHGFAYYNHQAEKAIGFVIQRLEQERLRIA
jgi:pimeloyl-ACP methyl ester carboxylesterase